MKTSANILPLRQPTVEEAVTKILEHIGEDPARDGLRDTPGRVARMWKELTAGYHQNPGDLLSAIFSEENSEMVLLKGINFSSVCEHHLLPFTGTATVAYLPNGKIVGISKLARVVECFARRLQVQERLAREIAEAIDHHLSPLGVAVFIKAHHSCMGCRGVEQPTTEMITLSLKGTFKSDSQLREQFLTLTRA